MNKPNAARHPIPPSVTSTLVLTYDSEYPYQQHQRVILTVRGTNFRRRTHASSLLCRKRLVVSYSDSCKLSTGKSFETTIHTTQAFRIAPHCNFTGKMRYRVRQRLWPQPASRKHVKIPCTTTTHVHVSVQINRNARSSTTEIRQRRTTKNIQRYTPDPHDQRRTIYSIYL